MAELIDLTGALRKSKARAPTRVVFIDLTRDDGAAAARSSRRRAGAGVAGTAGSPARAAAGSPAAAVAGRQRARPHRAPALDANDGNEVLVILDSPGGRAAAQAGAAEEAVAKQGPGLLGKRKEPEAAAPETQQCTICFEDVATPFMHSFGDCGHAFCLQCLREYVSGKVEERVYPICCPLPTCKKPISEAECNLVLTPEEQDVLGKMEAEAAVADVKLYCPNPKCSMLLIADVKQADAPMDCPHCSKPICTACGVMWHAGLTCQQFQALPAHARGLDDAELLALAGKENWRRCPKCGQMVERIMGCSFIRCRCNHTFCYGCGNTLSERNHYCTCKSQREQWAAVPPAAAAPRPAHPPHVAVPGRAAPRPQAGNPPNVMQRLHELREQLQRQVERWHAPQQQQQHQQQQQPQPPWQQQQQVIQQQLQQQQQLLQQQQQFLQLQQQRPQRHGQRQQGGAAAPAAAAPGPAAAQFQQVGRAPKRRRR